MTCKNCGNILEERTSFCEKCGAKVIKDRITTRILIQELLASFGWDSLYVNTLKKMFTQPHEVLKGYLNGARKKYVNPFAYLAVGAALSLIIFNFFSKEFIEANNSFNKSQNEALQEKATADLSKLTDISEKELENLKREQKQAQIALKFGDTYFKFFVNYFNIISFLFIPFYALISKLTFRKPNNYGEHIVINSYLQGTTMYISIIFFILGMITTPKLYPFSTLAFIMFYLYAFGKLYQLNAKQIILKFLRFCIISALLFTVIVIVISLFSLIIGIITGYTNP
ncbi:zinc ribbon protein [Tenacibaculum skagerrakense]|uniref:Zinc ribbon protein n=1 Tax=Tenacibaculum skagerrakense TaxID=186571 RepID=A0A4R2P3R6_9FLAO|nr:DUF3667 domain-containing protein [Tenacibaculum skagerrakense]TCP28571.1 zinc ribbon protein [Tenacibaculum skagerrakense]